MDSGIWPSYCIIKVHIIWEGRKNLKKSPTLFWRYKVVWKQDGIFFQILWPSQNIWTLIIQQEGHMPLSNYAKLQTLSHHFIRFVWFQVEIGKNKFYFLRLKSYSRHFLTNKSCVSSTLVGPPFKFWHLERVTKIEKISHLFLKLRT